jgi:transmembrane sensor
MEKSINDSLIHRFLNKETSELENKEILHWVSAAEENRAEFRKSHQLYHLSKIKTFQSEIDIDMAWNKLNSQLPKADNNPKIVYLDIFKKIAVAASIILAIGFGSLWTSEHFFSGAKTAIVQFEATKGEKSQIVLSDGSHVWLNSQTILRYDALNPRKVKLEGEAYFEVSKDRSHPFEVYTASGMRVLVTGTKFNLRSYAGESYVETTLDEGEFFIEGVNSEKLAVLKPGQQSHYNIQNNELKVQEVQTEIYSLWKNHELRFSGLSFAELAPRIENWYGVNVKLDPKINKRDRFTMTIKTESLRELLDMMKLTSRFNYEINGSELAINAK